MTDGSYTLTTLQCHCCGATSEEKAITVTMSSGFPYEALCEFCSGLISSGLVRREPAEDGGTQYRQWRARWEPGDLVPRVR